MQSMHGGGSPSEQLLLAIACTSVCTITKTPHWKNVLSRRVSHGRVSAVAVGERDDRIRDQERAKSGRISALRSTTLADVRRSHSQDVTVSLDEVEAELSEIQHLLSESGDRGEQLRDALQARIEFAAGGFDVTDVTFLSPSRLATYARLPAEVRL